MIQGDKWNKYQAAANIMTRPKGPKFCLMRTKNMRTALEEINFPQIRKRVQELKHNGPITAYTDASTVRGHPNSGWGIVFIHEDQRVLLKEYGSINCNEDNTQAELFAIFIALKSSEGIKLKTIRTDSQACIAMIEGCPRRAQALRIAGGSKTQNCPTTGENGNPD